MTLSTSNQKTVHHSRANSSPLEAHPSISELQDHLCKIKSSNNASSSSSQKLNDLVDMYVYVDHVLQLPLMQQSSVEKQSVEPATDGTLRLLDICSNAGDLLRRINECIQALQSALRRRCGEHDGVVNAIGAYLDSRRNIKKQIVKASKTVKKNMTSNEASKANPVARMLEESQLITFEVFDSLFSYIGVKSVSKTNRSLFSKLVHHKRLAPEKQTHHGDENDKLESIDVALQLLLCPKMNKSSKMLHTKKLKSQLVEIGFIVQDLQAALECLSRHLIKTRVSLLNILTN